MAMDIILERETANDDSALLVTICVTTDSLVERDDLIFEIENSKALQELRAPSAGILSHSLKVGQNIEFGVPIARIVPVEEWAGGAQGPGVHNQTAVAPQSAESSLPPAQNGYHQSSAAMDMAGPAGLPAGEPRVSRAAAGLLAEYGLSPKQLLTDFIIADDVRAHITRTKSQASPVLPLPTPPTFPTVPTVKSVEAAGDMSSGQPIGYRKRAEIEALSKGAGETMLSVLGVSIGTLPVPRQPGDLLRGRITDLVIYEASRLMKKFPKLNSFYLDGKIVKHDSIHAGLAIDSGGQLVVYGIEDANRVNLHDLAEKIADAVDRYVSNELTAAEMSRATFTVTDLSADELDFVLPLLPRGQSCILGITHSAQTGFRIFAGFDHRVTEGREVATFLGELRERLLSFASRPESASAVVRCSYCDRSAVEAVTKGKEKGLLKVMDRHGSEVLCCASCWNGW